MPNWHMRPQPPQEKQAGLEIPKPTDDNDYFERMSRVILASGLNWRTLEVKWPGIKQAFADFDVATVAGYAEPEIDALMANPAVIRNLPKIRAIVANAGEFQAIAKEHGGFGVYLTDLRERGGEAQMREAISKRFAFMGKGTTVIFLYAVGEDLPEAMQEWEARHQGS
jgi:3-methyladenine DNA glycosylase Tag